MVPRRVWNEPLQQRRYKPVLHLPWLPPKVKVCNCYQTLHSHFSHFRFLIRMTQKRDWITWVWRSLRATLLLLLSLWLVVSEDEAVGRQLVVDKLAVSLLGELNERKMLQCYLPLFWGTWMKKDARYMIIWGLTGINVCLNYSKTAAESVAQ